MPNTPRLGLFEGVGIELEYMIVDAARLAVAPLADRALAAEAGRIAADVEFDDVSWSNELVLHVIELKTTGPVAALDGLTKRFAVHVARINAHLAPLGARLMPTAMHPWMAPRTETRLWPHEAGRIYRAFDRIFDCRSHGWANLQSIHINLPFAGDAEFARLHAAVRLLLPILPALAAASPIVQGRTNGTLDNRLNAYRTNCARVPSLTGQVIPEPVFTRADYQKRILRHLYRDIGPYDPDRVLRHEWVNARGAIARFSRNTIEIRLLDMQECPAADLAIAAAVIAALKLLVDETWTALRAQQAWSAEALAAILDAVIVEADAATITNEDYLAALGYPGPAPCSAGQLWRHLINTARARDPSALAFCERELAVLLERGPLARRILHALGPAPVRDRMTDLYRRLCDNLAGGIMFEN